MRFPISFALVLLVLSTGYDNIYAQKPDFKVIAFYTTTVERDHVDFAENAIRYFSDLAHKKNFVFDTTTNWSNHNEEFLKKYQVVMWVNEFPHTESERRAFEEFMSSGGAWLGFHVSGYNDKDTHWPWFVDFMGGAVFHNNNWPPLAARLTVDEREHPVTKGLTASFRFPINEWYEWKPSPRLNKDVTVLVTLDPSNFPLGKKHLLTGGDVPVVWTNRRFKMLYMNMGHGDQVLTDSVQNRIFSNGLLWLGKSSR